MRKIKALILSLFTILFCISIQAAPTNTDKWYQIELLIFSHITEQGLNSEQWPWTTPSYQQKAQTIRLNTNLDLLPDTSFVMKREEKRISEKTGYHILLHIAWRQQIRHPRFAKPIHIFGGMVYNPSGNVIANDSNGNLPYNSSEVWQVNGTITISIRRYLGLNLNLLFANPTSELPRNFRKNNTDNVLGQFAYFRLLQSRRMRSKELNYIGHPLYGVLVKVIPLKDMNVST